MSPGGSLSVRTPKLNEDVMYHTPDAADLPTAQDEWLPVLEEEATPLHALDPPEYALYKRYFIDYFPKRCFHVKRSYTKGFIRPKKKDGQPLPLYPELLTEALEQHLDPVRWDAYLQAHDPERFRRDMEIREAKKTTYYWFALTAPAKTSVECADLDNKIDSKAKNIVGWYYNRDRQRLPVVRCPLAFVQKLHRFWTHFPNRVWCISSETLGIHAWLKKLRPEAVSTLHDRRRRHLDHAGLAYETEVEVHPNPTRCHRRPFGVHYRIITDHGVLTDWREQVRYFHGFRGPAPSFDAIVNALGQAVAAQWANWERHGDTRRRVRPDTAPLKAEWAEVREWVERGCPESPAPTTAVIAAETGFRTALGKQPKTTPASPIDIKTICQDGRWVPQVEEWAVEGLPSPDSVSKVVLELAEWLCWVECFGHPDRHAHVSRLLWTFVQNKHNGFVTRLNNGKFKAVRKQIERIVTSVLKPCDNEVWRGLREKRDSGRYKRVIYLAQFMASKKGIPPSLCPTSSVSTSGTGDAERSVLEGAGRSQLPPSLCPTSSVSGLPQDVMDRIAAKAGRNKVIPFATKLLNLLAEAGGTKRLSQDTLLGLLGYPNRNRVCKYKNILIRAGVLAESHYIAHKRCREYTLLALPSFVVAPQNRFDDAQAG